MVRVLMRAFHAEGLSGNLPRPLRKQYTCSYRYVQQTLQLHIQVRHPDKYNVAGNVCRAPGIRRGACTCFNFLAFSTIVSPTDLH